MPRIAAATLCDDLAEAIKAHLELTRSGRGSGDGAATVPGLDACGGSCG